MPSYCFRDDNGWRIPGIATRSARIYTLAKLGIPIGEITEIIGGAVRTNGVLLWKIKHPEESNQSERDGRKKSGLEIRNV